MDLWASFSNSGVYLAVLAGGYLLKRAGLFRVQDARFLSAVIMNITLPAAIVKGFAGVELSGVLLLTFVFSFLVSLTLVCTGAVLSRGRPAVERGTTILNTNTFNCGNFAIPFLSGVVSSESFAAMCMFDVGAAIFTYGPNAAVAQRAMGGGKGRGAGARFSVEKAFHHAHFSCVCGDVALSLLHWELPGFVMNVAVMAGNANSFLAMLCIGILFEVRVPAGRPRHGGPGPGRAVHGVRTGGCGFVALAAGSAGSGTHAGGDAVCAGGELRPDDHH